GPTFFSLLVIAVAFLPVLTLQAQEGRMFRPLAYTKTLTMVVAAILAITLDPALRLLLTRVERFNFRPQWLCRVTNALLVGKVKSEDTHPLSRRLIHVYEPVVRWTLRWRWLVIGAALAAVIVTIPVFYHLGSESMPPLDEGAILYMPTTLPGISIQQAQQLLQMSAALKIPGLTNSGTMPIRGRIDMLTTGIRTPVGLKIAGADLRRIQEIGAEIESLLKTTQGTRTVLAERTAD